jgi:hypothetical protein
MPSLSDGISSLTVWKHSLVVGMGSLTLFMASLVVKMYSLTDFMGKYQILWHLDKNYGILGY